MKTLLIVAHGSRRESSNEEVRELTARVSDNASLAVDEVVVAFLEFASPSISTAMNNCLAKGADEVVVLPYFLSAGNHVVEDIPRAANAVLEQWPEKGVTILPHIGANVAMAQLISGSC
ncbi:Sirohydrochlorin cobaltochelatase [Sinobacterium norvegicum]|uniref:Sirohydrochlorin cobaltochelatase n=1 Tax=Sinobacterium norvegicum TaxID=1641715 RepID=A0ABN8EI93_9GAMM|nr:CbiX/SirB N-terminal domain-containing protein [Sinobacterium norvegicum]CAH0992151.1 Sirohydrochlorin cobaltochelatase [Sinobacterium norvegicum]